MKQQRLAVRTYADTEEDDRAETISELDGFLNRGQRFYPIDTAISALYWLEHAPPLPPDDSVEFSLEETLSALRSWLADETPEIPIDYAEAALDWLQRAELAVAHQGKPAVQP